MTIYRSLVRSASTASLRNQYATRPEEMVRILVGAAQQEFSVNRRLLSASTPYFASKLQLSTTPNTPIYLAGESPAMFELFVVWLHDQAGFRKHLDATINGAISPASLTKEGTKVDACSLSQRLHWALVRLHLFASNLELPDVQDAAMDALQDLYLRRDWDVTPRLIKFLYAQCSPHSSLRLRRWAGAMVAFTLSSTNTLDRSDSSVPAQFHELFKTYPDFSADYANHLRKMGASGLDLRVKNPQLRVPTNRLRNEERRFAFRQCAFHTHRAKVGEGRCPHGERERRARRVAMVGEGLPEVVRGELAVQKPGMGVGVGVGMTLGRGIQMLPPLVPGVDVPRPLRRMRSVAARA